MGLYAPEACLVASLIVFTAPEKFFWKNTTCVRESNIQEPYTSLGLSTLYRLVLLSSHLDKSQHDLKLGKSSFASFIIGLALQSCFEHGLGLVISTLFYNINFVHKTT